MTNNTATRADVLDWRAEVTDPVLNATLPEVTETYGKRGALSPAMIRAFEADTGRTFGGYTTGKVAQTVTVTFRKRNNRPTEVDVPKSEFRDAAAKLGFAKAGTRGRLPKGVYADARVLAHIAESRGLKAPKDAVETLGTDSE